MFRIAKSHFNDSPDNIARDQTASTKAITAYNDFLRRFPDAEESAEARTDLNALKGRLAQKELYIGHFYLRRDLYESAKLRFSKVVEEFPGTPEAAEAAEELTEIEPILAEQRKKEEEASQ